MRQRFEALGMLVKWKNMVKIQTDRKVKGMLIVLGVKGSIHAI